MIFEFIVASIISAYPVDSPPAGSESAWDSYINYQLEHPQHLKDNIIKFQADIPSEYHEHIIIEANKSGWGVSITPCVGFYVWEECYEFTFWRM